MRGVRMSINMWFFLLSSLIQKKKKIKIKIKILVNILTREEILNVFMEQEKRDPVTHLCKSTFFFRKAPFFFYYYNCSFSNSNTLNSYL